MKVPCVKRGRREFGGEKGGGIKEGEGGEGGRKEEVDEEGSGSDGGGVKEEEDVEDEEKVEAGVEEKECDCDQRQTEEFQWLQRNNKRRMMQGETSLNKKRS
jgi:hypothetical protein